MARATTKPVPWPSGRLKPEILESSAVLAAPNWDGFKLTDGEIHSELEGVASSTDSWV